MKGMSSSVKLLLALMGCSFIFGIQSAMNDINIKITGKIYIPPCKINGNDAEIQMHFGKMSLYDVDGQKNSQTKVVTVSCDYYQGMPYILIDGAVFYGGRDNVLKTTGVNLSTLGIALYQGGDMNTAYPLRIGAGKQGKYGYKIMRGLTGQNRASGTFTFTAVPVKYGSGALTAGTFSATATMSISYL